MASTIPLTIPDFTTLADVLASVDGISPARIRFKPTPGSASESDVIRLHTHERRLCELIDGVLVEKAMGTYESMLAMEIGALLLAFAKQHQLGVVLGADGMLQLWPGRIRIPDACFISWAQLPDRRFPNQPVASLFPELAVEVLSEGNTPVEMNHKLHDYFESGTRLVWLVSPDLQQVAVYQSPTEFFIVASDGILDGGEVLPGLRLPVAAIFSTPRAE